jgi:flavin reductase (DIM6/NTAB) family NADH-FMN oxidoreductase RutF
VTGLVISPDELTADERRQLLLETVVPRPIAWTSTVSRDGVRNLAPFSFFTVVSNSPAMLSLTLESRPDGSPKDTAANIAETREFVVNAVSAPQARAMWITSLDQPPALDEFAAAGLTPVPSDLVAPPRLKEALISMECSLVDIVRPGGDSLVIGRVLRVHLDGALLDSRGRVDVSRLRPVGRLGGTFTFVEDEIAPDALR